MKKGGTVFGLLLLLAFAVRLAWFFASDNAGNGDASARLNITQQWLYCYWQLPRFDYLKILNPSVDWLPLHFYLMGLVSYIFHDLVYAPRLFTVLISTLTLVPLYKICMLRYNRTIAYIAVAMLAFYGMHIFLSGLILSESFYLFFLLWCYYFIERYRTEVPGTRWIVLLGLSLFACCLLRYEGWFFAPLVIAVLPFAKRISLKNMLILLIIPALAAGFVMVCEIMQGQHAMRGLLYSDIEVRQANSISGGAIYANLLPAYLPVYIIAVIWVVWQTLKTKGWPDILILGLYLLPVCAFLIKLLNGTVTTQARYLVIYMAPGIIFIAAFIYSIAQKFRLHNVALIMAVVAYLVIANISFAEQVNCNHLKLKYAPGFMRSAHYFRDSVSQAKAYIDYGQDMSNGNWMVYADLYDAVNSAGFIDSFSKAHHIDVQLFLNRVKKGARYKITGQEYEWKTWSIKEFDDLLQKNEITYIVLFPDGLLSKSLHFSGPHELYLNRKFTRQFSEDGYMIYKIEGYSP